MFAIGQKVVCVRDDIEFHKEVTGVLSSSIDLGGLKKGQIYTIRWIGANPFWGNVTVQLEEIIRPLVTRNGVTYESGYAIGRFRPLEEKKQQTDISILKKLLNPVNHRHLEGV